MEPTNAVLGGVIVAGLVAFAKQFAINAANKRDIGALTSAAQKVKAGYSRTVHVTELQADLEIEAYKNIWDAVVVLDNAIALSNHPIERINPKHRDAARGALTKFEYVINSWKPFYFWTIFEALDAVGDAAREELRVSQMAPNAIDHAATRAAVTKAKDDVCGAIRSRLADLTVYGDPDLRPDIGPL